MNWKILDFDDFKNIHEAIASDLRGSDSSLVNIFLLQKKYDIHTAIEENFLFRFYTGGENRSGYGFPIKLKNSNGKNSDFSDALEMLFDDAKANFREFKFCLLTETQKNFLEKWAAENHPEQKLSFLSNRDDCDYIYEREKLARLAGKTYHKKKNHVSKFLRLHEGNWEFRLFSLCSVGMDIITVAEKWMKEHVEKNNSDEAERKTLEMELESIKLAVNHKDAFNLEGGVLYVRGNPVAMTLASKISSDILDIHFEKCLSEAAENGAYAAINWCFANSNPDFKYLNREEDMGVEGLRKAKLSYHPDILLEKFYTA